MRLAQAAPLALLATLALAGCGKTSDPSAPAAPASAAAKTDGTAATATTVATTASAKPTAAATAATDSYKGPLPSEDKPYLGLTLPPSGHWKPEWDNDAKVAKWDGGDEYMTGVVIRIVTDKLDTIDDLKAAAPMMMQLGSDIDNVAEQKTTAKGWYAVVTEGGSTELVYVRPFGAVTTVCSANVGKPTLGKAITKDESIKLCESYSPKS